MATSYIQGLTIETPDQFELRANETWPQAMARYLSQCSIGSATSENNNAGSSAPTAENIGQLQNDVASLEARMLKVEKIEDNLNSLDDRVDTLEETQTIGGTVLGLDTGGGSQAVTLPSTGVWSIAYGAVNGAVTGVYHTKTASQFTVFWSAAAIGAALDYVAKKTQ